MEALITQLKGCLRFKYIARDIDTRFSGDVSLCASRNNAPFTQNNMMY